MSGGHVVRAFFQAAGAHGQRAEVRFLYQDQRAEDDEKPSQHEAESTRSPGRPPPLSPRDEKAVHMRREECAGYRVGPLKVL